MSEMSRTNFFVLRDEDHILSFQFVDFVVEQLFILTLAIQIVMQTSRKAAGQWFRRCPPLTSDAVPTRP